MSSKRVVITGVSRGLGLAMVEQLIELGHVVAGSARSAVAMRELTERFGSPHDFQTVDVSDDAQVQRWSRQVLDNGGPPDLLVNNAALINSNASLWQVPAAEFSQVIDVNIKGVFHVIRHFVPSMIERGSGVIVNISSGWGRSTAPEVAPYCATKWAIEGLTKALADELPAGMAAVPLNPGIIHTEMLETCFGPDATAYPSPTEWAKRAVPFLLALSPQDNGHSLTAP
ncbi:MAG: SDR family oxidoreductase [Pirellulaceae bacterium]|nr:SDR family oxidoreductase [Pirellulaceae bacterium]